MNLTVTRRPRLDALITDLAAAAKRYSRAVTRRPRLDALITDLAAAAKRYSRAVSATNRSQHLAAAAVMFVTCVAIDLGENPATMRDLEQRLLAVIAAPTKPSRTLITDLATAAKRYTRAVSATDRSQPLATAAVMFVTCAAIDLGENPATMRDFEQRLLATITVPAKRRRS